MKTKEQIAQYNKEYFARPHVIARAKIRNSQRRQKRKEYKQTEAGKRANQKYMNKPSTRDKREWSRIRSRYGISKKEYEDISFCQLGLCAICLIKPKGKLHVDHDHQTGKIRGLLCGSCNRALGLMKDNVDFLSKAIEYLIK
jgi:hypothetical protein